MFEEIEKWVGDLSNRDAGWVTRRDAAEHLGQAAAKAVKTLRLYVEDGDRDVREMVEKALGWAKAGLEGIEPVAQERPFTLEELATSLEKAGSREVAAKGAGYEITAQLRDNRAQKVQVEPATSTADKDTIRVSTRCGKASDKALRWALRNNTGLSHCALALAEESGEEMFVMVNSFLADAVTPAELKSSVKEVAYYGDWVESKLTGGDEF